MEAITWIIVIFVMMLILMRYEIISAPEFLQPLVDIIPRSSFKVSILQPSDFGYPNIRGRKAIVVFGASWCGHCKHLIPVLEKLSAKNNTDIIIGYIDASINRDIATEYGIDGFPTIKLFTGSEVLYYRGKHDLQTLTQLLEDFNNNNYANIDA